MNDIRDYITPFFSGILIGFSLGAILIALIAVSRWEYSAIKANVGEYNSKTGEFQWKQLESTN